LLCSRLRSSVVSYPFSSHSLFVTTHSISFSASLCLSLITLNIFFQTTDPTTTILTSHTFTQISPLKSSVLFSVPFCSKSFSLSHLNKFISRRKQNDRLFPFPFLTPSQQPSRYTFVPIASSQLNLCRCVYSTRLLFFVVVTTFYFFFKFKLFSFSMCISWKYSTVQLVTLLSQAAYYSQIKTSFTFTIKKGQFETLHSFFTTFQLLKLTEPETTEKGKCKW